MTAIRDLVPPARADTHALLLPDILFSLVPQLDFHALLRCQRVCRIWRSVISRSREARQTLFLEADSSFFDAFRAAEEHDVACHNPPGWQRPSQRIPSRAEFRAMFNPWIYTHGCEPIGTASDNEAGIITFFQFRQYLPVWRFTDRVSSGRLDFCFTPAELTRFTKDTGASYSSMFITQPPVKRVVIVSQGGYMAEEKFDLERDEGVKIGDIMSVLRGTKAVAIMNKRRGNKDFTTVNLKFDEHFTGVRFMKLKQLLKDQYGNVSVLEL